MIRLTAYCLEWHVSSSDAFVDLLVEPLKEYADIRLVAWDGNLFHESADDWNTAGVPLVFCQFPPPPELLQDPKARLVWIPMWDMLRSYPQSWWDAFPKWLRVVSYSRQITQRVQAAGLPFLELRYFKNPQEFYPANWGGGRILFYWNRNGMIGPLFLERLCEALEVDRLLFLSRMDRIVYWKTRYSLPPPYALPSRLGNTIVEEVSEVLPRADYLRIMNRANIFIAPRVSEGVGMTFMEALARGCAVFAFNAPTMNEYIQHRHDGYLLPNGYLPKNRLRLRLLNAIKRRLLNRTTVEAPLPHSDFEVTEFQNWDEIRKLNLLKLGQAARMRQQAGYAEWQKQIPHLAKFVLDWD